MEHLQLQITNQHQDLEQHKELTSQLQLELTQHQYAMQKQRMEFELQQTKTGNVKCDLIKLQEAYESGNYLISNV